MFNTQWLELVSTGAANWWTVICEFSDNISLYIKKKTWNHISWSLQKQREGETVSLVNKAAYGTLTVCPTVAKLKYQRHNIIRTIIIWLSMLKNVIELSVFLLLSQL